MKKLAQLLQEMIKGLEHTFNPPVLHNPKKPQAAELEKAWYTYLKDKENKTPVSEKQRKLLYQFMHFHRENDLN